MRTNDSSWLSLFGRRTRRASDACDRSRASYADLDASARGVTGQSIAGYGISGIASTGRAVNGTASTGYGVFGAASSGIGARGWSTTGTALYASTSGPKVGTALRAIGRVKFDNCAGVATIASGANSVTVTPGSDL